jgi:hypothetical protein
MKRLVEEQSVSGSKDPDDDKNKKRMVSTINTGISLLHIKSIPSIYNQGCITPQQLFTVRI